MTLDVEGRLHTRNGYVVFDPASGRFGALPVPLRVLQSVFRQMTDSPTSNQNMHLPSNLKDLFVEDSKIVLTYR